MFIHCGGRSTRWMFVLLGAHLFSAFETTDHNVIIIIITKNTRVYIHEQADPKRDE